MPEKSDQRVRVKKEKLTRRIKRNIENVESKLTERNQRMQGHKQKRRNGSKKRVFRGDERRRGTKKRGRRSSSQSGKKPKKIKARIKKNSWQVPK